MTNIPRCTYAGSKHRAVDAARVQVFQDLRDKVTSAIPCVPRCQTQTTKPSSQLQRPVQRLYHAALTVIHPYRMQLGELFDTRSGRPCFKDPWQRLEARSGYCKLLHTGLARLADASASASWLGQALQRPAAKSRQNRIDGYSSMCTARGRAHRASMDVS